MNDLFEPPRREPGERIEHVERLERPVIILRPPRRRPRLVTWISAAVLIAFFIVEWRSGALTNPLTLLALGAGSGPLVQAGEIERLVTANLLHGNFLHIFFNLYALLVLAPPLEQRLGSARLLILFLASCIAGALASAYLTEPFIGVGASTGIFGLLGGLAVLSWQAAEDRRREAMRQIFFLVLMLGLPALLVPNADHMGHVGGLLAGMALTFVVGRPGLGGRRRRGDAIITAAAALLTLVFVGAAVDVLARYAEEGSEPVARTLLSLEATPPMIVNEIAWTIAIRDDATRDELLSARDAMTWAREGDDDLILAARDTLATVLFRLGELDEAIALELDVLLHRGDDFHASQLARFEHERFERYGPILRPSRGTLAVRLVRGPDSDCPKPPRSFGMPPEGDSGLWIAGPIDAGTVIHVVLERKEKPIGLVRFTVDRESSDWVVYPDLEDDFLACGVWPMVTRVEKTSLPADDDGTIEATAWRMSGEAAALPGPVG